MLELIISLLIAIGAYTPGKTNTPINVVDQATGDIYGIGTTGGVSTSITAPVTYLLVKDARGNYRLVKI